MKLRPMHDRVIVKADAEQTKSKSGIILAHLASKETTVRGDVVAHGNGAILESGEVRELDVSVGDIVVFDKTLGTEVIDDGEKYISVREADIMFVLSK